MRAQRQSNFEVMRIFSILLIISFHIVYHSAYTFSSLTISSFLVKSFMFFGEIGVNCFLLITGYFMVNSRRKPEKLLLLIAELLFYLLLARAILVAVDPVQTIQTGIISFFYDIKDQMLVPQLWFFTAYVLLYLVSPYLNLFFHAASQQQMRQFLLLSLLLWCILPTLLVLVQNGSAEQLLFYTRFLWAILVYFIGAYLRQYGITALRGKKRCLCFVLAAFAALEFSLALIGRFYTFFAAHGVTEPACFWFPNTIPIFVLSVALFCFFLQLDCGSRKWINTLASTTLGIYLLTEGVLVDWLNTDVLHTKAYLEGAHPLLYIFCTTGILFLVGTGIDLLRQALERITLLPLLRSAWYQKKKTAVKRRLDKLLCVGNTKE